MTFQLSGIDSSPYQTLFDLDDTALQRLGVMRCVADSDFGYPCRVSLKDAKAGETLLLLSYEHQPAASPYRATGPIFIRVGATQRTLPPGVVPPYVARRQISLRAYDAMHMMVDAALCDGLDVVRTLERMFTDPVVAYVHLHNAVRGCFSCLATRSDRPPDRA